VAEKETRTLFGRVLRQTAAVRRQLTAHDLQAFLASALPPASAAAQQLQEAVKQVSEWPGGDIHGTELLPGCVAPVARVAWPPAHAGCCCLADGRERDGCRRGGSQRRSGGGGGGCAAPQRAARGGGILVPACRHGADRPQAVRAGTACYTPL
jgi:hypothetical protein